jgi:hypothetical protein
MLLRQTKIRQGVSQRFGAVNCTKMVTQESMAFLVIPLVPGPLSCRSGVVVEDAVLVNQGVALNAVNLVPPPAVTKIAVEFQDGHLPGHLENVADEPDLVVVPFGQSCSDPIPNLSFLSDGQFAESKRERSTSNRDAGGNVLVERDDVVVELRRRMEIGTDGQLAIGEKAAVPPNVLVRRSPLWHPSSLPPC